MVARAAGVLKLIQEQFRRLMLAEPPGGLGALPSAGGATQQRPVLKAPSGQGQSLLSHAVSVTIRSFSSQSDDGTYIGGAGG